MANDSYLRFDVDNAMKYKYYLQDNPCLDRVIW